MLARKMPWYEEKIDLQTNNPRKLFRVLTDLFEDEISKRGYGGLRKNEPTLEGTGVSGVAEFRGGIEAGKVYRQRSKLQLIIGIIVMVTGIFVFLLMLLAVTSSLASIPPVMNLMWLIPVIVGIIIILLKRRTELIIAISMKGESYQYRGNKQTTKNDIEKRGRLDVVSDVRLKLICHASKGSYVNDIHREELKSNLRFINEKLNKIVPEYRIPT